MVGFGCIFILRCHFEFFVCLTLECRRNHGGGSKFIHVRIHFNSSAQKRNPFRFLNEMNGIPPGPQGGFLATVCANVLRSDCFCCKHKKISRIGESLISQVLDGLRIKSAAWEGVVHRRARYRCNRKSRNRTNSKKLWIIIPNH
jgi:hypothetical protein